jgi:outer membrane protein assembly factor BamB
VDVRDPLFCKSFVAGGAINPFRLFTAGASAGLVIQATGPTVPLLGIVDILGAVVAGDRTDGVLYGAMEVEYGGAVAYGDPLTSDTLGRAVKANYVAGAAVCIIGYAMDAGVLGDIGSVLIVPSVIFNRSIEIIAEVSIPTAALLALNATPISLIAAPGAGKAIVPSGPAIAYKPAGTAYAGIAAGEDLALKYTDASGTVLWQFETTGFLDQATAQARVSAPSVPINTTNLTPVENAALVAHLLVGEITTGTSDIKIRIPYKILDVVW